MSKSATTGGRLLRIALAGLSVIALLVWAASGFYTVESNETGIVTRFGRYQSQVTAGIHYALPWPVSRVHRVASTDVKRLEIGYTQRGELFAEMRRSDMLTGDQNILKVMMVVQYKVRDPKAYLFRSTEPDWLVERAVTSAMCAQVGSLGVDDVLTSSKGKLQVATVRQAQQLLDAYDAGVTLLGGNLQHADPPVPVRDAFTEVSSAKKDSERLIAEAQGYAGKILPQARGEARRITQDAQSRYQATVNRAHGEAARFLSLLEAYRQAPEVTRRRLFLDTMTNVLRRVRVHVLEGDGGSLIIVDE